MRIVALADIHGNLDHLESIAEELLGADLVLLAGDITNFGGWSEATYIISELSRYNSNILAVAGNCDRHDVENFLADMDMSLHCRCVEIDGLVFTGIGGAHPEVPPGPNEVGEKDFGKYAKCIETAILNNKIIVLLTHEPAKGAKVDLIGDRHAGSEAIAGFIKRTNPVLAVSGHIHEAVAVDKIESTTVVNPGPFRRGFYARITIEGKDVQAKLLG